MEESPLDLLLNSEPAIFIDWRGFVLGALILAIAAWAIWQDGRDR